MYSTEILNRCFSLLSEDESNIDHICTILNAPQKSEDDDKEFIPKQLTREDVIFFLVRNLSTNQDEHNRTLDLMRFFATDLGKSYLEKRDEKGTSIAQIMVGLQRVYGKDLILSVLRNTPDVQSYKCSSPKTSTFSLFESVPTLTSVKKKEGSSESSSYDLKEESLLDYMICQKAFDKDTPAIAIEMLDMGIPLYINDQVLESLKHTRALNVSLVSRGDASANKEPSLTEELCYYFIEKRNQADLFFALARNIKNTITSHSGTESRVSRSSSMVSSPIRAIAGLDSVTKELTVIFKNVIKRAVESGAINRACETRGELKESIPTFLLYFHRHSHLPELWNYLQAAERINKLSPELFELVGLNGNLLHEIAKIKDKNIAILEAVFNIIKKSDDPEKILSYKDKDQKTALFLVCEAGWDRAIEMLFSKKLIEETDAANITPLCAAADKGFRESCRILLELGTNLESLKSNTRPLYHAIIKNNESVTALLLAKGANPNAISTIFKDFQNTEITPLQAACEADNSKIVELLIHHLVNLKNGNNEYFPYYLNYKNSSPDLTERFNNAEISANIKRIELARAYLNVSPEDQTKISTILTNITTDNNLEYAEKWASKINAFKEATESIEIFEEKIHRDRYYRKKDGRAAPGEGAQVKKENDRLQQLQLMRKSILQETTDTRVASNIATNVKSALGIFDLIDFIDNDINWSPTKEKMSLAQKDNMKRQIASGNFLEAHRIYKEYNERVSQGQDGRGASSSVSNASASILNHDRVPETSI